MILIHKKQTTRRGQAVVELALILPILMLILMGIVEFGRIFMAHQTIANAAREGARTAVLPTSTMSDVSATISAYMTAAGLTGSTNTTATNVGASGTGGDPTSVTVSYDLPILTGTIIPVFGPSISLARTTVMRHE